MIYEFMNNKNKSFRVCKYASIYLDGISLV